MKLLRTIFKNGALNWLFVAIYAVAIFYYSSKSLVQIPGLTGPLDWLHVIEYLGFGLLVYPAVKSTARGNILLVSFILLCAYAASDEIHQHFVPGRVMDPYDWLVDALGGALGLFLSQKALS